MDLLALILLYHAVHEVEKFEPSPAFVMPTGDLSRANVERREQGRGAIPLIIVRLTNHRPSIGQLQIPPGRVPAPGSRASRQPTARPRCRADPYNGQQCPPPSARIPGPRSRTTTCC